MSKRRRLPNNNLTDDDFDQSNIDIDEIDKEEEARINEILQMIGDDSDCENPSERDTIPLSEYKKRGATHQQRIIYLILFIFLCLFMWWVNYYNYKQMERIKEEYGPEKKVEPELWWQKAVIYHVYIRSFKDSNGDGIGDIKGLHQHLDHFLYLGIDAILLSDIFESPMVDLGYDVSNFTTIDPLYGTIEEFRNLIDDIHEKGLKLIIQLVPNHSSTKHLWFQKSRIGGKGNKYRDYYIWHNGNKHKNGTLFPPNNWLSKYGGPAWTFDTERQQFYYHKFHSSMPEFNHRDMYLQEEVVKIISHWVTEYDIDGLFLADVHLYFEADDLSLDEPTSDDKEFGPSEYGFLEHIYTEDHADIHDFIANWREVIDKVSAKKKKRIPLMIDVEDRTLTDIAKYFETGGDAVVVRYMRKIDEICGGYCVQEILESVKLHLPDEKDAMWTLAGPNRRRMSSVKGALYQNALNMLVMLLPGAVRTYYGEELGLGEIELEYKDTVDLMGKMAGPMKYKKYSRDYSRAPMPWNSDRNYGFTRAEKPWLPMLDIPEEMTVQFQREDPSNLSPMHLFGKLTRLRKEHSFMLGEYQYSIISEDIFSFMRFAKNSAPYLIAINVGDRPSTNDFTISAGVSYGKIIAYARPNGHRGPKTFAEGKTVNMESVTLLPGEGVVCMLLLDVIF